MHTHTSTHGCTHKHVCTFQLSFTNLPGHSLQLVSFYALILYLSKHFSHIVQKLVVPGALKLLLILTAYSRSWTVSDLWLRAFASSKSIVPEWGHFTPDGVSFCFYLEAGMSLCQDQLSPQPQGLDPSQESLVQPPHIMASLGLKHSDSSSTSAFQNNPHPSMMWGLAPAVTWGAWGEGEREGHWRTPLLLVRLWFFEECVLSRAPQSVWSGNMLEAKQLDLLQWSFQGLLDFCWVDIF